MEVNAAVPRTSEAEGLSVVSSLSEVSHQIAIAEEIPTEHESSHPSVFPNNGQVSSEETVEHQHCEVQVVKVANVGGVNITFATPALANLARVGEQNEGQPTTIQVSDAQLAPIQEVAIAQSPDEGSNSEAGNLQAEQVIHDIQDDQMQGSPLHMDSVSRGNNDVKSSWDAVMNAEVLTVRCRNESAELHKSKLGSGGRGKCIKYNDEWMTPSEFEARCGRASSKDWKRSIRYGGRTLQTLIEEGVLTPHATSCTCASCCNDDTLAGPVRLFVPYKRRKRVSSQSSLASPVLKKSMSLSSDPTKQERQNIMMRSVSVDSGGGTYVTEAGTVIESGDLQGNVNATSATHVSHLPIIRDIATSMVTVSAGNSMQQTPMTPITPMTPQTPMTPMTPIMVSSGLQFGAANNSQPGTVSVQISQDAGLDHKRHWWHIEEMVNSLLSTATQLKCMLEQVKLQSEAAREAAVAQAKLQAESEKKEVLAQTRMNSLLQLSKAINDAQVEREQAIAQALLQAKADKLEAVAEARQEQLIKTLTSSDGQIVQCQEEGTGADDKNGME